MSLKALIACAAKRTERIARRRGAVFKVKGAEARLKEFERAVARTPAAYAGITYDDLRVWSGCSGVPKSTFCYHIGRHHPAISRFMQGGE